MKKMLLLCTLFSSYLYSNPDDSAWSITKKATSVTAQGAFETITSKSFWKSAITSTAAFNTRFFFPSGDSGFSLSSLFGNPTLRSCLCSGFIGSVLNRSLPDRYKGNSLTQVALEHPFLVGIFAQASWITTKTYWNAWNSSMKDNPAVWLLGTTGGLLGCAWLTKKINKQKDVLGYDKIHKYDNTKVL